MRDQTNKQLLRRKTQRTLRRNMTDAELRLWYCLRNRQLSGYKFRRQHPFRDFVLDFVCMEERLVVEVDGGQHADSASDEIRTKILTEAGFKVIRFWNNDVLTQLEAVKEAIYNALGGVPSTTGPHP